VGLGGREAGQFLPGSIDKEDTPPAIEQEKRFTSTPKESLPTEFLSRV
jgi:hypothetical protein